MGIFSELDMLLEGKSSNAEELFISIKGKGIFNGETSSAIGKARFNYKDDAGEKHEDGKASIFGKTASSSLTSKQESGQREVVLSLRVPKGSSSAAYTAINKVLKTFKLSAKKLDKCRKAECSNVKK